MKSAVVTAEANDPGMSAYFAWDLAYFIENKSFYRAGGLR